LEKSRIAKAPLDALTSAPKVSLPFDDNHPHLIHPSSTNPTHYPRWHLDAISHFATIHFVDWQTDWPTDRWARWMFRHNSRLCLLDRSDTVNNIYTAIPLHWHDCRSPTWSLTLTKHGPNSNPTHNCKRNRNCKS